ncbi:VENN motif pre-toxin domain-containing protein, partial [Serratia microhaemolytica]|uniref:VENN motif pre-toxin domain-containing protein n=1 Tax=Serratia microhaemolytica TaxID=2675110 RepID=UPI001981B250
AAGASAELMANAIMNSLYPGKKVSELTEEEKQNIASLSTLAAGLAGGLLGDSSSDTAKSAQIGKNAVENNYLSVQDVLNLEKELEAAEKTGADKLEIYEKYAEKSEKNREESVAESCSGNVFCANGALAEAEAGSDMAKTLNRFSFISDLSSEDAAQLARFVLAENEESALAIYQALPGYVKAALNGKEAVETIGLGAAVGGKGLAALGVMSKANKQQVGNKDNRLPIPEATVASNGLKIESNTKHTPGAQGFRPDAGIEPRNSLDLFENSIQTSNPKVRLAIDSDGNIHRFFNNGKDGSGAYHWSGSTGDKNNALGQRELGKFNSEVKQLRGVK